MNKIKKYTVEILQALLTSRERGEKITLKRALDQWGGQTWADLVHAGFISLNPTDVTVTVAGQKWLEGEM